MTYAVLMGRGPSGALAIRTLNVEGDRALAVFESAEAADEFRMLSGLGPEWKVVDDPDGVIGELLREIVSLAPHMRYVVVNPRAHMKGEPPVDVSLIPIERFLED